MKIRKVRTNLEVTNSKNAAKISRDIWRDLWVEQKPITFFVECKPVSWNSIATQHWRKWQPLKAAMVEASWAAIKLYKVPRIVGVVELTFEAHYKDKRLHDADNLYVKATIDTLVREGIIEADDYKTVRKVTLIGSGGHAVEGISVTITSVL